MTPMLNVDQALARLERLIEPIKRTHRAPCKDCSGRFSALPILAPLPLPPFEASAMDGYAICTTRITSENSKPRHVIGESLAGKPFNGTMRSHEAVRIFTGAQIPQGADAVVPQEDVVRENDQIRFLESPMPGANIRQVGTDVDAGDVVLQSKTRIDPYSIGWLAACGISHIEVYDKINVAVFSTGDELQDPNKPLQPGQIYDSNRTLLAELLKIKPTRVHDLGRLPDDPAVIESALSKIDSSIDVVLTSGGVSVGDADYVRPVVEKIGTLNFWNIALKPGKPLAVGTINDAIFFGLPGNPVSTVITYLVFVAPTLDKLSGGRFSNPLSLNAKLSTDIHHTIGRREYQRGTFFKEGTDIAVKPTGEQSSHRLATLANANCLIVVPESASSIHAGSRVEIILLPREGNHLWSY